MEVALKNGLPFDFIKELNYYDFEAFVLEIHIKNAEMLIDELKKQQHGGKKVIQATEQDYADFLE